MTADWQNGTWPVKGALARAHEVRTYDDVAGRYHVFMECLLCGHLKMFEPKMQAGRFRDPRITLIEIRCFAWCRNCGPKRSLGKIDVILHEKSARPRFGWHPRAPYKRRL